MTAILGYLALASSLYAVTKTNMKTFRWWHLLAGVLYTVYGFYIQAYPIALGGFLYICIHSFQLKRLYQN